MKTLINNLRKLIFNLPILLSLLFAASCSIGLGEAVDLTGPEVTITSPDFMANVSQTFTAKGTAADNIAVTKIVISFENEEWVYENGKWDTEGATFENGEWSVNLTLPAASSGEYVLSVTATDAMNNTGKKSVASRTVVYDKEPPVVTVTKPSKLYESSEAISQNLPVSTCKNFTYLSEYLNGDLTIQGYQDEKFSLAKLNVWVSASDGTVIYTKELTEDLRNWSVTVPAADLGTGQNFYQVITQSTDEAGNESLKTSHGFFCWWPDADTPWIETTKLETSKSISDASEANYYPGYKFQGQCYDDDGIKSVTVQLYDENNKALDDGKFEYTADSDDEMQTFYPWTITLPENTGVLKLIAKCTDKNGKESESVTGYLKVLDITSPRIEVEAPVQTVSLFGDENGDVTFSGTARDDSGVKSVKMVWLKNESDLLTYTNGSAAGWNTTSGSADSNGNKVWETTLGTGVRGTSQIEYSFSKTLNLFTDLGIGSANKLTGQTFLFRVEDTSSKTTTLTYAVQGDIKAPVLTITKVYVKYSDDNIKELTTSYTDTLPAFGEGTLVKVEGTWSDDSTDVWSDKTKITDTLTVDGLTSPSITIDGNKWTTDYVNNAATGGLSIKATVTDLAGSSTVAKASYAIETDNAAFDKMTASNADGNYKAGDVITIQMKFTKAVTVTGNPVLSLSNGKTVSLSGGNGTKIHEFAYTVGSTDSNATNLNAAIKNASSCKWVDTSSKATVAIGLTDTNNLAYNKSINIITSKPVLQSVVLNDDGDKLTITYDTPVYKNAYDLTLTQKTVSAVPSVLTESEYKKLYSNNSDWAKYYTKTTNGCDKDGNADLTAKYVLNYNSDSSNSTLINMYITANAHQVSINVKSSNVTISDNVITVKLTGSYALPCKGAIYTVSIPESFVSDVVNNMNAANSANTITMPGIEDPVIRVSKGASSFNTTSLTATQPLTSAFKIDCETPGASIKYGTSSRQYEYTYHCETHDQKKDNGAADSDENRYTDTSDARSYDPLVYANMDLGIGQDGVATSTQYPAQGTAPAEPESISSTYSKPVSIGSNSWTCGEKYLIKAAATTTGAASNNVYATANRSLFVFNNDNNVSCDTSSDERIWLRGGDSETGGVATAGFPLSWDPSDPSGIALMTQDKSNSALWYYLTWELNTTAYVGVVVGKADANSATQGPVEDSYAFGVNAWVPFKKWYCVYPGESRVVETKRYEAVYGKHRDFFKWNWVSNDSGSTGEEADTDKMNIVATMEAGYNTSSVEYDCTDIWQKTKINKWNSDTTSEGVYLIIKTEASSVTSDSPYVDIWSYNYGSRIVLDKVNVTPGETVKIIFTSTESNRWKWDNLYVGGLGVKITSIEFKSPYTELDITKSSTPDWDKPCTLVVTFEKLTDFDISSPTLCIYNWQDNEKVTLTEDEVNNGTYTYSAIKYYNYEKVKGYGINILSAVLTKD